MFLTDSDTSISYNDLIAGLNEGIPKHLLCSFVADIVEGRKINLLNYKTQDTKRQTNNVLLFPMQFRTRNGTVRFQGVCPS